MTTEESSAAGPSQFFVRWNRTIVIQAYPHDTVLSLLDRIRKIMGIPESHHILTFKGEKLESHHTLSKYELQADDVIQVVGPMPSTMHYEAWEIINSMVFEIRKMSNGDTVPNASLIKGFLDRYLNMPAKSHDNFQRFLELSAPEIMVMLYTSKKSCGEECIRHFLNSLATMDNNNNNTMHIQTSRVLMEFCTLLCKVAYGDPLYIHCKNVVLPMLKTSGVWCFSEDSDELMIEILRHVRALTNCAVKDLSFTDLSASEATGKRMWGAFMSFKGFFVAWSTSAKMMNKPSIKTSLRCMLFDLTKRMEECLRDMVNFLATLRVRREVPVGRNWYFYMMVLNELYHMSKLHDGAEQEFLSLLRNYRKIFSLLVLHYAKRNGAHEWILEHKSVTDFKARRHLALMMFFQEVDSKDWHKIIVDRAHLVVESFEYMLEAEPEKLQNGVSIEFKDEIAIGPGVQREWFILVCQQLFDPKNAIFMTCPEDHRRIFPNSSSKVHHDYHRYYKFAGRVFALALKHKIQVGVALDRVFFSLLAGKHITLEDIKEIDPQFYSSCKLILEMDDDRIDSDVLGLTFTREEREFGVPKVIELCPGGGSIAVNSENRNKFVDLLIKDRFATSISDQVAHFAKGFADILSKKDHQKFFQSLELEDLDWMLYGSENAISIKDWKTHMVYKGYKRTDPQMVWFWEILERMSVEERKNLLFFWTSMKYLPIEGFQGLSNSITIAKSLAPVDHLPSSHTCFNQLNLPVYPSIDVMEARLRIITQEHFGFTFGQR